LRQSKFLTPFFQNVLRQVFIIHLVSLLAFYGQLAVNTIYTFLSKKSSIIFQAYPPALSVERELAQRNCNPRRLPVFSISRKASVKGAKHRQRRQALDTSFRYAISKIGDGELIIL